MEEYDFSTLKNAMQIIPTDSSSNQNIIKYNYNDFKSYCLTSCNNSIETSQFNTIFNILTSKDHQNLRRGLIYKSQVDSIELTFEPLKVNRVRDPFHYILWNSSLLALPDHEIEEGNERQSRSRRRSSTNIDSRDVRQRRTSNDGNNIDHNNGFAENINVNIHNENNAVEVVRTRPTRQHRVPTRYQRTQSPILCRNRYLDNLQRNNVAVIIAENNIEIELVQPNNLEAALVTTR